MAISSLPPEVLSRLAITIVRQAGDRTAQDRTSILSLCAEAIEFAKEASGPEVGIRARSAAGLLLSLSYPELGEERLRELSIACEKAAHNLA